jgi:hypothetical protein
MVDGLIRPLRFSHGDTPSSAGVVPRWCTAVTPTLATMASPDHDPDLIEADRTAEGSAPTADNSSNSPRLSVRRETSDPRLTMQTARFASRIASFPWTSCCCTTLNAETAANDAHLGAAFDHYFDALSSRSSMTKRMSVTASTPAGTQIACNPHTPVVNAPAIAPAANVPITPA